MGTYDEGTMLGSVYVGGLREEEIESTMDTRIDRWKGDETILFEITYQGYSYQFDRELFNFDVITSRDNITPGSGNQLEVSFIPGAEQDIRLEINDLPYLAGIIENVDVDQLIEDILHDASFMKSFAQKEVEDYLIDDALSYQKFDEINVYVPNGINIDELIESISSEYDEGKIMIPEQYLFDITDELGSMLEDNELTVLSTGILGLILETNFSINEVHYENKIDLNNYTIDDYPFYGFNSKVFEREDESFSFYNPNDGYFYLTLEKTDVNHMTISIWGLPFVNEIEVTVNKTFIEHSIKTTFDEKDLRDGLDGVVIEVYRRILDIDGNIIFDKVVNFEFYPPEVEIIVAP
jgi:hypothetical protein